LTACRIEVKGKPVQK